VEALNSAGGESGGKDPEFTILFLLEVVGVGGESSAAEKMIFPKFTD
jgi:hypothetical protein